MTRDDRQLANEQIVDIDLTREMQDSFLEYSYSVIYARALPDARDGLKPVQRRIIYQMGELGLRPDRGHVKSARVVGDVMGKLHPHGDGAIYDAMVRLAQPFSQRLPLVDGHGNFGSLDDGPAASRYTEARLTAAAVAMNQDLDEDVVDFRPNYDAQLSEPEVLPAAYPNLLVNGGTGIAVGMATNMPPHNLREVVAAAQYLLANPGATTDDLMEFVPGPDLPGGAIILAGPGIRECYETGRGSFKMRATVSVESVSPRRLGLVVTALPYLVGPEKVIEKIKEGVNAKRIQGIADVVDLTDRTNGLKLVIELKTGFDPAAVLDLLYRYTPLEEGFSVNNVALVAGRPQQLGLRDLLGVYLAHRVIATRRRSKFRLEKFKSRLHLVSGLLLAIADIDRVIALIRAADDVASAKASLIESFRLSEEQAEYILELRLRRLTKFSRLELEAESKELAEKIAELEKILASEALLRETVSAELGEVADRLGDARRTVLQSTNGETVRPAKTQELSVSEEPCHVTLHPLGLLGRSLEAAQAGATIAVTTRTDVGLVTSLGRAIRVHASDIPSTGEQFEPTSALSAQQFLGLTGDERVVGLISLADQRPVALATASGVVKRVVPEYPNREDFELIALKTGDEVVAALPSEDDRDLVFVTNDAQLLRLQASSVRPQGRAASGMAGINLSTGARVIHFAVAGVEAMVATCANSAAALPGTSAGSIKLTALEEFPRKGRGTSGVRCHKFVRDENQLYLAAVLDSSEARLWFSEKKSAPLGVEQAKRDASGSRLSAPVVAIG